MNRLLIFHTHDTSGNEARMAPSGYYIDADYQKFAVRAYAETAPTRDAKFDIFADGVSIFSNRTNRAFNLTTGVDITGDAATEALLSAGQNSEEIVGDFNNSSINKGAWVYCNLVDAGGGKNFTVQLELSPMSEGEVEDD